MNQLLKKCPNCGADIKHNYNHQCPYCRTYLHLTDEEIKTINNCDIKVDRVEIERNPLRAGYIITILGWSTPKCHYFEEATDYGFVVSGSDVGKRVGYKMELPFNVLYNEPTNIPEYIYSCIPPEFCNGYNEDKILSECLNFFCEIKGKRLNI